MVDVRPPLSSHVVFVVACKYVFYCFNVTLDLAQFIVRHHLLQLYVGLMCNLIVFPINFLVVTLFRRARPKKKRPSRIQEALRQNGYDTKALSNQSSTSDVKKLIDSKDNESV